MTEETNSKSAAANYFNHVIDIMKENEIFLRENMIGTYEEVIDLTNITIDNIGLFVKRVEREKEYVERSMAFFTHHVLMPFSFALYLDLLVSNVPACFMELRLMLESLVKCYLADLQYPETAFFQEKLRSLEQNRLSTSKLMKVLGKKLGVKREFVSLWCKLSQDWLHTKGFTDKLVAHLNKQSDMPRWSLVIPINYTEKDLNILEELRNRVSQFRSLLVITMEKYRREFLDTG